MNIAIEFREHWNKELLWSSWYVFSSSTGTLCVLKYVSACLTSRGFWQKLVIVNTHAHAHTQHTHIYRNWTLSFSHRAGRNGNYIKIKVIVSSYITQYQNPLLCPTFQSSTISISLGNIQPYCSWCANTFHTQISTTLTTYSFAQWCKMNELTQGAR